MAIVTTFSTNANINTEAFETTLVTITGGTALSLNMSGNTTTGGNQRVVVAGLIDGLIYDTGAGGQRDDVTVSSTGMVSGISLGGSGNVVNNYGSVSTGFFASAIGFLNTSGIFTANEANRVNNFGVLAHTAVSNSGYTIDVAAANTAKTLINNSGTIFSGAGKAISLSDASDIVKNSGTIFGDVRLGGGFNNFDSTLGTLHGNIFAGDGGNNIKASNVGNSVTTGIGIDYIWGGSANDFISSGGGDDRVHGGNGDDIFIGGAGADRLRGNAGDDSLDGGADADTMTGGAGDDRYYVDSSADIVNEVTDGGAGHDTIVYEGAFDFSLSDTYQIRGLVEDLILEGVTGFENINGRGNDLNNMIVGNNGNNFLSGLGGDDELFGGDGNDTLDGGGSNGDDTLYGGNGNDTYNYYSSETIDESDTDGTDTIIAYTDIDLEDYYVTDDDDDVYYFRGSIEIIELRTSRDSYADGDVFDNTLIGNSYQNQLNGRDGADFLYGKFGNDRLTGGTGADRFYFDTTLNATSNVDTITDFVRGTDKIYVDDSIFVGVFNTGATMNASLFRNNASVDSNDRIIYKRATGEIFYDADGNGTGTSVVFAVITGKPILTATDFVVI